MSGFGTLELMSKMLLKYQTPLVSLWHCLTYIGRLLPVNICGSIYSDDQFMFKCDTQHTGCTQLCFNRHSPVSHLRYFNMLILFLTIPKILFYLYAAGIDGKYKKEEFKFNKERQIKLQEHQQAMQAYVANPNKELIDKPVMPAEYKKPRSKVMRNAYQGNAAEVIWVPEIIRGQIIHLILLFIFEILGLIFLNQLQQHQISKFPRVFFDIASFDVKELYECRLHELGTDPLVNCGHGDMEYCYVVRPTEKKVRTIRYNR